MIYFDNAATSFPKPPQVAEAVYNSINGMGAPNRGAYPVSLRASRMVYSAREAAAELFNAESASSAVFMSGATEGLNTAINGLLSKDDHAITTVTEHNSVLRPLYRLGCGLSLIPCDGAGRLVPDGLAKLLRPNTRALIVSHVSNVTGNAADLGFFSKFCRDNGLYFIIDAAQSAGSLPVDASLADVVCFTGHKSLFGPQGTGGIIATGGVPIRPLMSGGSGYNSFDREPPPDMPERLEAGILNGHGIAGLLAGMKFIKEVSVAKIAEKEAALTRRFVEGVSGLKHIKLFGDLTRSAGGAVVSLLADGYDSAELSEILAEKYDIATRPGIHCAPLMHKALGTEKTGLTRFSFSYFNTAEEIDYAVRALAGIK